MKAGKGLESVRSENPYFRVSWLISSDAGGTIEKIINISHDFQDKDSVDRCQTEEGLSEIEKKNFVKKGQAGQRLGFG